MIMLEASKARSGRIVTTYTPLWPKVEPLIAVAQPQQRLPPPNASGWIANLRSPLRADAHAGSFSVRPDSPTDPGAWKDFSSNADEERGSIADLALRLGLDPRVSNNGHVTSPQPENTLARFCERRTISHDTLQRFGVREGIHAGRPALLWPTPLGVDRVKYLDGQYPKYCWQRSGGKRHLYGFKTIQASQPAYLVNGEPAVWACYQAGVPAFCLGGGEGAKLTTEMLSQLREAGPSIVRIAYDRDQAGRDGARAVVAQLREVGIEAVALELPATLGEHGDVDDLHRLEGGSLGDALAGLSQLRDPADDGRLGDLAQPAGEIVFINLSEVEPEPVRWLWEPRIPYGKLTLLVGDPGEGKSWLSLALGAAETTGAHLPGVSCGGTREPGRVILATFEDGLADTVRLRADAVGARLDLVTVLRGVVDKDGSVRPFHASDVTRLEAAIKSKPDTRMLVIDPVASLLGGNTDTGRDNQVRAALQPLVQLAESTGVAVVGIMHLNKAQAMKATYRVAGSGGGFVGLARSVLLVARDEGTDRRAVVQIKNNLAEKAPPLEFTISHLGFAWVGEAPELTADRLLNGSAPGHTSEIDRAKEFLRDTLAAGPVPSERVKGLATEEEIKLATLRRAREALGVVPRKGPGTDAPWLWELPSDTTALHDAQVDQDEQLRIVPTVSYESDARSAKEKPTSPRQVAQVAHLDQGLHSINSLADLARDADERGDTESAERLWGDFFRSIRDYPVASVSASDRSKGRCHLG